MVWNCTKKSTDYTERELCNLWIKELRTFACSRLLVGNDVLSVFQFSENCLGIVLHRVCIWRHFHKPLQVVGSFLEIGLIARSVDCQAGSEVCFRTVRRSSES